MILRKVGSSVVFLKGADIGDHVVGAGCVIGGVIPPSLYSAVELPADRCLVVI